MKKALLLIAALAFASTAFAQVPQTNECTPGATHCTGSNQNSGDVTTTTNNGTTHSSSAMLGTSSASNASGNNINPEFDNRAQTTRSQRSSKAFASQSGCMESAMAPNRAHGA